MDIEKFYRMESNWLSGADLDGKPSPVVVTIKNVAVEEFRDGNKKPRLDFEEPIKPLTINKTNARIIVSAYGTDTDKWIGRKIGLIVIKVRNKTGDLVDGITITTSKATKPVHDDMNDDVPF